MPQIRTLDHVNLTTPKLDETVEFFERFLGLENRPEDRPPFGVPGAWLWVGDQAVVHLIDIGKDRGEPAGALDHVAFRVDDLDPHLAELDDAGVPYRVSGSPELGMRQAFFQEPNGITIELTQAL